MNKSPNNSGGRCSTAVLAYECVVSNHSSTAYSMCRLSDRLKLLVTTSTLLVCTSEVLTLGVPSGLFVDRRPTDRIDALRGSPSESFSIFLSKATVGSRAMLYHLFTGNEDLIRYIFCGQGHLSTLSVIFGTPNYIPTSIPRLTLGLKVIHTPNNPVSSDTQKMLSITVHMHCSSAFLRV